MPVDACPAIVREYFKKSEIDGDPKAQNHFFFLLRDVIKDKTKALARQPPAGPRMHRWRAFWAAAGAGAEQHADDVA